MNIMIGINQVLGEANLSQEGLENRGADVFVCVLSLLIARLFEKTVNQKYTISVVSHMLSELKATPVRTSGE